MTDTRRGLAVHIGRAVRERRINDGLSDAAVARVLDMPLADYQDAEAGDAHFTAEDLYNLCTVLRVRVGWFFEGLDT